MATSRKHTETIVGLFVLIGLLTLAILIVQFGRINEGLPDSYPITVVFKDASGLVKGSEVRMSGARIGKVAELPELNNKLLVEVPLAISGHIKIPKGARFEVSSASFLGDKLIDIVLPADHSNGYIAPESRIEGAGPGGLDALQSDARTVGASAVEMMARSRQTLDKVDAAVLEIQAASKRINDTLANVNERYLTEENSTHIHDTLNNFSQSSQRIDEASKQLAPTLIEARDAIETLRKTSQQADQTLTQAQALLAEAKPALASIPKATASITQAADQASTTLAQINQGKGFLGAMAQDNDIALDAKAFFANLRRFGILRYRDGVTSPAKTTTQPAKKFPRHHLGRP